MNFFENLTEYLLTFATEHQVAGVVGYSMGGRLALAMACQNRLQTTWFIESASAGLTSQAERAARKASDELWLNRLSELPFAEFLELWYQQSVFAELSEALRLELLQRRSTNNAAGLAKVLPGLSVANQPGFEAKLGSITSPLVYIYGKQDRKYKELMRHYHKISGRASLEELSAGHNTHWACPEMFAALIKKYV